VVLAVAREYKPPSFDICLPCDAGILGGFSGCFSGFFLVGFGLFRPGAARAPVYLPFSHLSLLFNKSITTNYSKECKDIILNLFKIYII